MLAHDGTYILQYLKSMTYFSFLSKVENNSEANLNNAGHVSEVLVSIRQTKLIPTHGPASQRIMLINISGNRAKSCKRPD